MAVLVYVLCLITAIACAAVLLLAWRRSRTPLLFWSGLCFLCLAANEALVLIDFYVVQDMSLLVARRAAGFLAVAVMLVGLILHSQEASE